MTRLAALLDAQARVDDAGNERCDECKEEVGWCTCTCPDCGDSIHECACDEDEE